MKRTEVELWVQRVLRQVTAGAGAEEQYVELKREWPTDFAKVARRIAGHANSALGEPVLWLIGVDERHKTVATPPSEDPAKWYAQVRAQFADAWAPDLTIHNIPHADATISALLFTTEGAPYIVKAPQDRLEVPWRDSTAVRSARRAELFWLLSDAIRLPDMEVLYAEVHCSANKKVAQRVKAQCAIYATPRSSKPIFFPYHKMSMTLSWPGASYELALRDVWADEDTRAGTPRRSLQHKQIECDGVQLTIGGPGFAEVHASGETAQAVNTDVSPLELRVRLSPAGSDTAVTLTARVTLEKDDVTGGTWRYDR